MARRSRSRSIVRTVTARAPSPIIRVSAPPAQRRRRGRRRRSGSSGGGGGILPRSRVLAFGSAAALGYAEKTGIKIPILFGLSPAASAALIALALAKFGRVQGALDVFTGLGCVALNRFGAGNVPGGAVLGSGVVFDDDVEGYDDEEAA